MLMPPTVAVAVLPLVSVAVPVTDWPARSDDSVWSASHAVMNRSAQTKCTMTAVLFHPAPFGAGLAFPVIVGFVVSRMVTDVVADPMLPAASVARQVIVVVPSG